MSDEGTMNTQVIDATSDIVTLLTGQSPAQSFAMLDAVMVETLGMAMHNAVHRQQNAGMVNSAAVTAACAKMLSVPFPTTAPPPPPSGSSTSGGTASPLQPLTPLLTTSLTTLPSTVTGGSGNSTVASGSGNSTVTSGTGNSTVTSGTGNSTVTSGSGNSTVTGGGA
ncbi:RebB family R body protein [Azospirillum isscasi]|uniref:RebB family R body protein n=1 Tax=Azospirillum isscasi TaxID=3053926 RepID=A0ABU0WPR0_9PROT|nr:RebB family R body protein [Azospirillum isscasi]MDQ2106210.1 RebB family R body protein [Azospirillum isscasi]